MKKINKLSLAAMLVMAICSLVSTLKVNANIAVLTLVIGIPMYFIMWKTEKTDDLLDVKTIPNAWKDKSVIILFLMPMVMNAICNIVAKLFVPDFIEHLTIRADFLAMNKVPILLIQLAIAALGEEIAWRAFFQNQLTKAISFVPALIVSSGLFSICHCTQGNFVVVLYDLLFVFLNAAFYGAVFKKTNNAFVSSFSHFLANIFGIVWILLL